MEKREPSYTVGGSATSTATMENTAEIPLKPGNRTAILLDHNPAIPLLGIRTEETRSERDTCTLVFTAALFTTARTWKQPTCPSADEWIRKLWYKYTVKYSVQLLSCVRL